MLGGRSGVATTERNACPEARSSGVRARTRIVLVAAGPIPVTLVGLSTFGWWTFRELATAVLPVVLTPLLITVAADSAARDLVVRAMGAGLAATFLYDLVRWGFLLAGWMARDPIPHLGSGLGLEPGWIFGYLWRYAGNGGGLAITFFALGAAGLRAGATYGLLICGGLLAILAVAPNARVELFPLDTTTIVVAVTGHLIYGTVLGALATRVSTTGHTAATADRRWR